MAATEYHLPHSNRSAGGQHSAARVQSILQDAANVSGRPRAVSTKILTEDECSMVVLATSAVCSWSCLDRTWQRHDFHPHSIHFAHKLHGNGTDRRITFCEWVNHKESEGTISCLATRLVTT